MTFEKTLVSLVENRRWASVKDVLKTMNPADAAGGAGSAGTGGPADPVPAAA